MTARRDAVVTTIATAFAALLVATPLQARDSDDDAAPSDDILDAAITCVAAYDTLLTQASPDDQPSILQARAAAVDLYAQVSGEDSGDILKDIRQADADLPAELADDGDTVDDYAATCDEAFMDIGSDDADPPLIAAAAFPSLG